MNRVIHIGLTLLALICCSFLAAQNSITKCEYWLDSQYDNRTAENTSGNFQTTINLNALADGLHSLSFLVIDDNGAKSPVAIKYFVKFVGHSSAVNALADCEYWIDDGFDQRKTAAMPATGIIDLSEEIGTLRPGLHSVSMRVLDKAGNVSPVAVKYFVKPQASASGDNVIKKYEYWIDADFDQRKTATMPATGIIDFSEDIEALRPGLHSVSMRVLDKAGNVSPVAVKYFVKPQASLSGDNVIKKYEYWIDRDFEHRKTVNMPAAGVVNFGVALASLSNGLHSISMRVLDKAGNASPVMLRYFLKSKDSGIDNDLKSYEYWFNDDFAHRTSGTLASDGIIDLDIDVASFRRGLHLLRCRVFDTKGNASATYSKLFVLTESDGLSRLVAYDYWINDNERIRTEVSPRKNLVVAKTLSFNHNTALRRVPDDYTFNADKKTVLCKDTFTIGFQVFDNKGTGSVAVIDTIKNYDLTIRPVFSELSDGVPDQVNTPTGGEIVGFSYTALEADSTHWTVSGGNTKLDFYDANGNPIENYDVREIDGVPTICFRLPTATVFLLTYGGDDSQTETTVTVAGNISTDDVNVLNDRDRPQSVYTIMGIRARKDASSLEGLPEGYYIVGKQKIYIRHR